MRRVRGVRLPRVGFRALLPFEHVGPVDVSALRWPWLASSWRKLAGKTGTP